MVLFYAKQFLLHWKNVFNNCSLIHFLYIKLPNIKMGSGVGINKLWGF